MFEPNSRYAKTPTASLTEAGGRQIAYIRRRFLPQVRDLQVIARVPVAESDRLDLITARALGDPEQFWRVCDASSAMNPPDLTAVPGLTVSIPMPQPQ
jgi:hypothetical protein